MTRVIQAAEWHASLVGHSLNQMRVGGVLCDIIIQSCEGREFLAHGCILAAASPILKAAISNTIGQLSTLRMEWLSGSVLETLLNFIYTGELKVYSGDTAMVSDFFYAVGQLEITGVLVTCKDDGFTGSGGSVTGGSATSGSVTGGSVTGGSVTGGSATGGSVTGRSVTGGSVTGGSVTGGSATGGSVTGGSVIGGSATGGSVTGRSVTTERAEGNIKGSSTDHIRKATVRPTDLMPASRMDVSSTNKGEVCSVNKVDVSANKAIISSENKAEVSLVDNADDASCSTNKSEVSSAGKKDDSVIIKDEVSSSNKREIAFASKLPPESSKSDESGADHSYADANSTDEPCTEPSRCEMADKRWLAKCNKKTRQWGCPAPIMVSRKNYLTRPYSLRCPICQRYFKDSLALASHRLTTAPLRVFRVWQGDLDETNDGESAKFTDQTVISGVQSTGDTAKPTIKSEVKPTKKGMFVCAQCGKEFTKKIELKHHSKVHVPPLTCPVCSRTCKSRSKLRRHYRSHTREKPYVCKVCNKSFQLNESLVIHSRLHTGERPFKCCICDQGFRDKSVLRNHELKHTGAKPFQCAQCGRQYGSRNALSRHRNVHTLERCYRCEHCARVFYQLSGLMCHRRTHTGEKPYICSVCARAFGDRSSMRRHERVHTGERPYTCATCNKTFTQSSSLKSHQKTHVKRSVTEIICVEIQPNQTVTELPQTTYE